MLLYIIFYSEKEKIYFLNYDFWDVNVNVGVLYKLKILGII